MKAVSSAEQSGFHTRLHSGAAGHYFDKGGQAADASIPDAGGADEVSREHRSGDYFDRETENILNLPGELPFFPTKTTNQRIEWLFASCTPFRQKTDSSAGPDGDGGYLVPDDLEGIVACFSPGVSNVAGFEKDCALKGMKVFMADASVEARPRSIRSLSLLRNSSDRPPMGIMSVLRSG